MSGRAAWIVALTAAALLAGVARAQVAWTRASDSGPPGRLTSANGMAYDSDRGVVVLFGGGPGNSFGDTWEWNGARWKLRSRGGPSPRWGAVMAYDTVRRVTVLHGGCDCDDSGEFYLGDTWEWDGKRWRQVAESGPTAQYRYGVFDTRRGVLVLLVSSNGETWEWNGESWTLVSTEGPEFPRWNTSMAYDSRRGVTVLHGGVVQPVGTFADTWEWDGETWRRVSTKGPPVREAHAIAYDSHRGRVVLMGGHSPESTQESFYDTWEWDGRKWREQMASGAPTRLTHTMVFDEARGRVLSFGGIRFDEPRETRGLKEDTWALESPIPSSRGDFDGDGTTDPALFDPAARRWRILGKRSIRFGGPNVIPVPGDYDGDGSTELASFDASTGTWRVQNQERLENFGEQGDLPAPADYDGDGKTDMAYFRPSEGVWEFAGGVAPAGAAWREAGFPAVARIEFGASGDIPIPGDYDGDGVAEPAVYRPSTRRFIVRGGKTKRFGKSGDLPVPADYDGDGSTDIAVWRPLQGQWKVLKGRKGTLGRAGQIPVPADYDGDGAAEFALYDPVAGLWLFEDGSRVAHGQPGEIPVIR